MLKLLALNLELVSALIMHLQKSVDKSRHSSLINLNISYMLIYPKFKLTKLGSSSSIAYSQGGKRTYCWSWPDLPQVQIHRLISKSTKSTLGSKCSSCLIFLSFFYHLCVRGFMEARFGGRRVMGRRENVGFEGKNNVV